MSAEIELLRRIYREFNRREIGAVLASLHANVDWPNGMEGGRVHGHDAVREYWTRQFQMLDPHVEPEGFRITEDGRIVVEVHQVIHDISGRLLVDQKIEHVYEIEDGLIRRMEIIS
jgi:SnoaL-like domain